MDSALLRIAGSGYVPRSLQLAHKKPKADRTPIQDLSPVVGEIAHGNLTVGQPEAEILDRVLGRVWRDVNG